MDASNQYSRRNCVLISRPNIDEHTGEDTNTIAIKVAKEGGLTIEPSDIDRSHRIGKPGKKKSRDIVVKFVSYQSKFVQVRKHLRQNKSKAYINEHITSYRGELAYQCVLPKKDQHSPIIDTWTYDGNIFVKTDLKGPMIRINCHKDYKPSTT